MTISVYQANDLDINVTISDGGGDAVDLTGATLDYHVAARGTDETALIDLSTSTSGITITDAAAGQATITLSNTDTDITPGPYVQELLLTTSGGNQYTVSDLDRILQVIDSIHASD